MEDRTFLEKEPIGKLMLKLAIPTVCAQVINMLYNLVDRIYVGHIPGAGALALTGLGVCFPIIMIVSAFASLVSSGGAPRASIEMGKKNNDLAEKILGNCFTTQIFISIALTVLLLIFGEELLLAFGASDNTISYASDYLNIYTLGTIFVQLTLGMNAFITAQGFAKTSMLSVVIGAICNIILDPVFIFAFGMGVKGAALATIISQAVSTIWVLSFLCGKKTALKIKKKNLKLEYKIVFSSISLGLANFIMQSSESLVFVCYNSSLLKYGGDLAVGAMTILTSVMQFVMMPTQGIGQGTQPIISYNYGAGNKSRVQSAFKRLVTVDTIFTFSIWLLCMFAPNVLVRFFTSDDALNRFASPYLRIYMSMMGLFGVQMACQATFTAIGCAKSSIIVAVMRKFVLIIPMIFILPAIFPDNKVMAVYLSEPVSDFISIIFCSILFFFQFRRALRKLQPCN